MSGFFDNYRFGCFSVNNVKFPRLLFGTSPFFGAGQFGGRAMKYYREFYLNPQNITRLYRQSISIGLNAIHTPSDPVIIGSIRNAELKSRVENFILMTVEVRNLDEELNLCRMIKANSIITHGSYTDSLVDGLSGVLDKIKNGFNGIPTGIATHSPGDIIPRTLEAEGIDVIMAPINARGEFMVPDRESTLNAIFEARERGRKVIAMKSLAAGRLNPKDAFKYVVDKVDGVVVGITSERELEEVAEAASSFFS